MCQIMQIVRVPPGNMSQIIQIIQIIHTWYKIGNRSVVEGKDLDHEAGRDHADHTDHTDHLSQVGN